MICLNFCLLDIAWPNHLERFGAELSAMFPVFEDLLIFLHGTRATKGHAQILPHEQLWIIFILSTNIDFDFGRQKQTCCISKPQTNDFSNTNCNEVWRTNFSFGLLVQQFAWHLDMLDCCAAGPELSLHWAILRAPRLHGYGRHSNQGLQAPQRQLYGFAVVMSLAKLTEIKMWRGLPGCGRQSVPPQNATLTPKIWSKTHRKHWTSSLDLTFWTRNAAELKHDKEIQGGFTFELCGLVICTKFLFDGRSSRWTLAWSLGSVPKPHVCPVEESGLISSNTFEILEEIAKTMLDKTTKQTRNSVNISQCSILKLHVLSGPCLDKHFSLPIDFAAAATKPEPKTSKRNIHHQTSSSTILLLLLIITIVDILILILIRTSALLHVVVND